MDNINHMTAENSQSILPITLNIQTEQGKSHRSSFSIQVSQPITVLIGPNGTGKTQSLRGIKSGLMGCPLNGKVVRYLSSGRNSPFEAFRSAIDGPGYMNNGPAYVGRRDLVDNWWGAESVTGDILELNSRPDLLLKVESRLQTLFGKSLSLEWSQHGLQVGFNQISGGNKYYANVEASGLLHLISMLAALYHEKIFALIIDEPEISLHPQLQAFFMQEVSKYAGDPITDSSKKLIILATHSASTLPVRKISDLTNLVIFTEKNTPPVQILPNDDVLKNRKLAALISRLSENHKNAFFAESVLLVEGPSDETIVSGLSVELDHSLLGGNAQVVPVTGKGAFPDAIKLFQLAGKRVVVLADLDAYVDAPSLINLFSDNPLGRRVAVNRGYERLNHIDSGLRTNLSDFVEKYWPVLETHTTSHSYWLNKDSEEPTSLAKKRSVVAGMFSIDENKIEDIDCRNEWCSIKTRISVLFDALEETGCFILRKGTVEDYYQVNYQGDIGKPSAAEDEVACWGEMNKQDLQCCYSDIIRAMKYAAPLINIDENYLIREKLGAIIGGALQSMHVSMSDQDINARSYNTLGAIASMFHLENISSNGIKRLKINIVSPLFSRPNFPIEISENQNPAEIINNALP